jgi:hypothetical protein
LRGRGGKVRGEIALSIGERTMMRSTLAIGTAVLLFVPVAMAQQRGTAGACAADIKEKCAGVEPGDGRIKACVKEHFAELSEPCQQRLARLAAIGKACAADVKQSCANVKPRRRGPIQACIKGVLSNLSDACRDALAQAVAGRR